MVSVGLERRAFVETLVGFPFGGVTLSAQTSSPPVLKVAAGYGQTTSSSCRPAISFTSRSRPGTAVARCS